MNPYTKKGIYIAALNQGEIRTELSALLSEIQFQQKYRLVVSYPAEKPISNNRNRIVNDFLSMKEYDYLMMIDGDNIPPINILDLADLQKDIIGALCFMYQKQQIVPLCLRKNQEGSYAPFDIKGGEGLVECDAVGTGCILIARRVLEDPRLQGAFINEYDADGFRKYGLDIAFCRRAKEAGFKVHCHTDYPISHWTVLDLRRVYGGFKSTYDKIEELEGKLKTCQIKSK